MTVVDGQLDKFEPVEEILSYHVGDAVSDKPKERRRANMVDEREMKLEKDTGTNNKGTVMVA